MQNEPDDDDRQYTHLSTMLAVSSGMVGVCLTAIGLIGIVKSLNKIDLMVDDLLAVGSLLFMIVATLSFLGMRTNLRSRWRCFTLLLDVLFCLGLAVLVVASMLLAWVVL